MMDYELLKQRILNEKKHISVLRYDYYGRGWSKANKHTKYDTNAYVHQIECLLKHVNASEKYNVLTFVGYSTGGAVGTALISKGTFNFDEFILFSPAIKPVPKPCQARLAEQSWFSKIIHTMLMSVAEKTYLHALSTFFTDTTEGKDIYNMRYEAMVRMFKEVPTYMQAVVSTNAGILSSSSLSEIQILLEELIKGKKLRLLALWGTADETTPPEFDMFDDWINRGVKVVQYKDGKHGMIFETTNYNNAMCDECIEFI